MVNLYLVKMLHYFMVIYPDDIIQLIFFSALFLTAIGVSKILLLIAWFLWSHWTYTTKNPFLEKAMRKQWGNAYENQREKHANKNDVFLMNRTIKSLKDPIIESLASLFIILITTNYLTFGSGSSGLITIIEILLVFSIILGLVSISWLSIKLQPYLNEIMEKKELQEME
jgi:hypothetical protein